MAKRFVDVAKYFKADEWNKSSSYEKMRFQNMYNNYKDLIVCGFDVPKPYFMDDNKDDYKSVPNGVKIEKKFKRKSVLDYELRKRSKSVEVTDTRYPKRNVPDRNYFEVEEIPEDRYVYCDECMQEYLDSCEEHTLIQVNDNPVPANKKNPDRARETVPKGWIEVKESKIKDCGDGIWALRKIPKGTKFGPYEGEMGTNHLDGRYCWQIKKSGKIINYIDGFNTSMSNWMRYVNCARNREEQNLMAFQYFGHIFYRSVVDIEPNTELLVYYGSKFAKELGIDVKNYNSPPSYPFPEKVFKCDNCYLMCCSPIYLEEHVRRYTRKAVASENDESNPVDSNVSTASDDAYKCEYCSMAYTIKSFYDKHLTWKHDNNKTSVNGRSSTDSGLDSSSSTSSITTSTEFVKRESSLDSGSRRFNCTFCSKVFRSNSNLENHLCMHTGQKPYACTMCNKRFTRKDSVQRHVRIHTGEKPYACTVCNKRFTDSSNLRYHTKSVHEKQLLHKVTKTRPQYNVNKKYNVH